MIQQSEAQTDSSVPYLGRIPGVNWLFGNTSRSRGRSELLVLITPRLIGNSSQANQITDEYRQQFQLIQPMQPVPRVQPLL